MLFADISMWQIYAYVGTIADTMSVFLSYVLLQLDLTVVPENQGELRLEC